jgi:hypothetical protein
MKWQRLSIAVRIIAGILGILMLVVGSVSLWEFYDLGGPEKYHRALVAMFSAVICGIAFSFAAITGLSPDIGASLGASEDRK